MHNYHRLQPSRKRSTPNPHPPGPYGAVTLGLRQRGAHAELSVRDTGAGIAAGDLPHVFERFYRADPARGRDPGGTGLGLAIARWIVEQHGGTIELGGAAGGGTLAIVLLPLGEVGDTHEAGHMQK